MDKDKHESIYPDYLQLDKLLTAQKILTTGGGKSAHEEHFFIIIHQVYELWFKQILAELEAIIEVFHEGPEKQDMGLVVIRLQRMNKIFHLLLQEFEVLETMSPLDFLNFRDLLGTMSGFQSYQFRLVEAKFGLRIQERMLYAQCPFDSKLKEEHKERIRKADKDDSLFGCLEMWLERCPLEKEGYSFKKAYAAAFGRMIREGKTRLEGDGSLNAEDKMGLSRRLEELVPIFDVIFKEGKYEKHLAEGHRSVSYKAFLSALFIRLYRQHSFLNLPDMMLSEILEVSSLLTLWRYRHMQMVRKMIGWKTGTGGTSGVGYLLSTVEKYDIFSDFHMIPMLLIPSTYIPDLPPNYFPSINFFFSETVCQ